MNNLQYLDFLGCTISEIKIDMTDSPLRNPVTPCFLSLSDVYVQGCKCLRELTWLMFAPSLTYIDVESSEQLEDIISKEKASVGEETGIVPFKKLKFLRLSNVPELKSIYWSPLPFPCLKTIVAIGCPKLKRLPLSSKSGLEGGKGLIIRYRKKEWIESAEWEDEASKTGFLLSSLKFEYNNWLASQCGCSGTEEWRKEMYLTTGVRKRSQPETYSDECEDHHLVSQAYQDFSLYTHYLIK